MFCSQETLNSSKPNITCNQSGCDTHNREVCEECFLKIVAVKTQHIREKSLSFPFWPQRVRQAKWLTSSTPVMSNV